MLLRGVTEARQAIGQMSCVLKMMKLTADFDCLFINRTTAACRRWQVWASFGRLSVRCVVLERPNDRRICQSDSFFEFRKNGCRLRGGLNNGETADEICNSALYFGKTYILNSFILRSKTIRQWFENLTSSIKTSSFWLRCWRADEDGEAEAGRLVPMVSSLPPLPAHQHGKPAALISYLIFR